MTLLSKKPKFGKRKYIHGLNVREFEYEKWLHEITSEIVVSSIYCFCVQHAIEIEASGVWSMNSCKNKVQHQDYTIILFGFPILTHLHDFPL